MHQDPKWDLVGFAYIFLILLLPQKQNTLVKMDLLNDKQMYDVVWFLCFVAAPNPDVRVMGKVEKKI